MMRFIPCVFLLSSVYSLCLWPCQWQESSVYNSYYGVVDFPNNYTATVEAGTFTCQERDGNFFILRNEETGLYTCFKIKEISEDLSIIHQTSLERFPTVPSVCEICTPEGFASVLPEINPQFAIRRDLVDLGCNVPKNCPPEGGDQCTDQEKNIPGDGQRCNERKCKKKSSNHAYRGNRRYRELYE